jgi:spore germination cell wall hydrolase CwlJ-like protein
VGSGFQNPAGASWRYDLVGATPGPEWLAIAPAHIRELWQSPLDRLLAGMAIGEAEGEGASGMTCVCCVARNRVLTPWWWGETFHEVVLFRHQFSCFWTDWPKRERVIRAVIAGDGDPRALEAAHHVLGGGVDITDGADSYFAGTIPPPPWAAQLIRTVRIGAHTFYRH